MTFERLTTRIVLQEKQTSDDGAGGVTESWSDLATLWADVAYGEGTLRIEGDHREPRRPVTVILRARTGLLAGQRLLIAGVPVAILSIRPDRPTQGYVTLDGIEGAPL
ncbi:MAG: phage head closure protein [Alphaproteobacteria bacterium]|nr:phage head closure protein [Alphaproteobacteria bacterium]